MAVQQTKHVAHAPNPPRWLTRRREGAALLALVALGALLRLTLAARGWPILNSDEATMGLMGSDILLRGAHPIFTYSQDYIGALQAYLAAPVNALLGPTPLALRIVTTAEFVAFLVVLYALARAVWSPAVGLVSVALLAVGPEFGLLHELYAGAGAQDTLLFGALLVWLAFLRLSRPRRDHRALWLALAFGLAAGLGLWGDFLFLPYLLVALLALTALALRDWRVGALPVARTLGEVALGALGFVVGAAPFIAANIASGGQTLRHAFALAQAHNGAASVGLTGRLSLLLWQITATLLVGLPQAVGSGTICPGCAQWPAPDLAISPGRLAQELAFAASCSVVVLVLWLWSALPLARDVRRAVPRLVTAWRSEETLPALDARWWGRLMLTLGGALTLLQYVVSRTSYTYPASSARYLIGLYICAPLVAAPLVAACATVWRAARSGGSAAETTHRGAWLGAPLGVALLLLILTLNAAGAAHALAATRDQTLYGQPMNQRDSHLVAFLTAHQSAAFYGGYWTCLRLVFTSQQAVSCAVLDQYDALRLGFNRYPPAVRRVLAAPNPAWVIDLRRPEEAATYPKQLAACVWARQPRCVGYTSATFDQYVVYYYAGTDSGG